MEEKIESWEEMLNKIIQNKGVTNIEEIKKIIKNAQEGEREYYFEQLGKIMDSMKNHKDCKKCYEHILYDMGVIMTRNITKSELIKAFEKMGFWENKNNWLEFEDNKINLDLLLEVLDKIPEIQTEIKKEHKHIWQFVEENPCNEKGSLFVSDIDNSLNTKKYISAKFVCECGATMRVIEKKVKV